MDPKATYLEMTQAIEDEDYGAAYAHAKSLWDWLSRGGFAPKPYVSREFRDKVFTTMWRYCGHAEV